MAQEFMNAQDLTVGMKLQGVGRCSDYEEAVVIDIQQSYRGHMKTKVTIEITKGKDKGRTPTFAFTSRHNVLSYFKLAGKVQKATVAAKRTALHEKRTDAYYKKAEAAANAELQYGPGDIVLITNKGKKGGTSWKMKVMEIDEQKGRVYGVNAEPGFYGVGGKRAWASLTHPDVTITLVQKDAFDPKTDATVAEQKAKAAATGAKRSATRQRKEELRSMFGSYLFR